MDIREEFLMVKACSTVEQIAEGVDHLDIWLDRHLLEMISSGDAQGDAPGQ